MEHLQSGSLQVIVGPMFSGKTTELLKRVKRFSYYKKTCIMGKYKNDLRYSSTSVCSHDGSSMEAIGALTLGKVVHKLVQYDVIGE